MDTKPLESLPELPVRTGEDRWHALTLAFWRRLGKSPMLAEYLEADLDGLYVLADLIDQYWKTGEPRVAAEIRQQRACFGLTPIDRRRLEWEIKKVEKAADKGNPPAPSRAKITGDPRAVLHAV